VRKTISIFIIETAVLMMAIAGTSFTTTLEAGLW
jgi:hypothetical protein